MTPSRAALFAAMATACGPTDVTDGVGSSGKSVAGDRTIENVRTTHYTLVTEASTSGGKSGDSSTLCDPPGIRGCYHKEFLCSGWGVAMQGTGLASNGKLIKYVRGGGGWDGRNKWLKNCSTAEFTESTGVTGASGRTLVDDYSIAVDPKVISLGSSVWIESEKQWFRADDTGGAIKGNHIDLYVGATGIQAAATSSKVYVTKTPHQRDDASPFGGGSSGAADMAGASCGGVDFQGQCQGTQLRWCEQRVLRKAECGAAGCGWRDSEVGNDCLGADDACGGLDYQGSCSGSKARWCEDGAIQEVDCGAQGCGWIGDDIGYYCQQQGGSCAPSEFACRDGQCISAAWACDDIVDCAAGEDEQGCGATGGCAAGELECSGGTCIPASWRCDGIQDCPGNDDEAQSECGVSQGCGDEFSCGDGGCIPWNWVCDGEYDCSNREDESGC